MGSTHRDRHGRGLRGPLAWPPVPSMSTRRERFDDLVADLAGSLRAHLGSRHEAVEFAVEDVPQTDPAPWEEQTAPLGKLFHPTGRMPYRVVVYRRPVESRAHDEEELAEIIREVLIEQVAALLGVPPEELEA